MERLWARIALKLSRGCSGQDGQATPRLTEERMATKDTGGQKHTTRRAEEVEETEPQGTEEVRERQEKLSEDVDAILDEIDDVLEENAEEFVRSYVQKGGQ
jgi:prokaryotic ubiquitin-like protein Pup